jgi:ATP-dependent protease HslVU (ClpYQ) ATPase subunit
MKRIILLATAVFIGIAANAQSFKSQQAAQEKTIKACQKKHTITDDEYEKLMKQQRAIKKAIEKAEEDEVYTDREKDKISKMIEQSANRLTRYKTNGEEY